MLLEGTKKLPQFLNWVETLPGEVTARRRFPVREPQFAPWPELDNRLKDFFVSSGMRGLYTHQEETFRLALAGKNVVVVTPTASGKTLCYTLPVLESIARESASRALFLFPTKALSQDQLASLYETVTACGLDVSTFTYDGDTPPAARSKVRAAGQVVITNPDMLHTGILPHHTKWVKLFENLRYIVIDELHSYRGIFGSHMANVLRRLKRICAFYGSSPTFICTSATIANPKELAERLLGEPVEVVARSGAPLGERQVLLYNPPVVNRSLGIRRSSLLETSRIAGEALANGISTIVFTRSRINVELLLTYLRQELTRHKVDPNRIAGYRGGYLPNERRAIERGLRSGELLGVVSTNALELGVDIGSLELAVLHGYPGSIASARQQMGRAGRRQGLSAAILVASSFALDQFLAYQPDYFFGGSPERARISPDNLYILVNHVKCGAFELPFREGEPFGDAETTEILTYLERQEVLHRAGGHYHWQADSFPAEGLSLRSATSENYVIIDRTETGRPVVIGEVDRPSAPMLIHPEAIYFHGGKSYQVTELDSEGMRCYVKEVDVDYYTDADLAVRLEVIDEFESGPAWGWGEVLLAARPTVYKKIRLNTHENVGYGHIHLGEEQMHTTACRLCLPEELFSAWAEDEKSTALTGLAHLLRITAPLFLMCDRSDIQVHSLVKDPHFGRPTIYLVDNFPGGVGLAEGAWQSRERLLDSAREALLACPCDEGCPACVGTLGRGMRAKETTRRLVDGLTAWGRSR